MENTFKQIWQNIYLKLIFISLITLVVVLILIKTRVVWGSFLGAFIIAYILDPPVQCAANRRICPRLLGVGISIFVFLAFVLLGGILLTDLLVHIAALPLLLVPTWESFLGWLNTSAPSWLQHSMGHLLDFLEQNMNGGSIANWQEEILKLEFLSASASNLFQGVGSIVKGLTHFIERFFQTFVFFMLTTFMLIGLPKIKKGLLNIFPERNRKFVLDLANKLDVSVGGYIRAKFIEAFIMGFVVWIVLSIIGVPESASLGFFALVLNPIPYLGPLTATLISSLITLSTLGWQKALIVLIIMQILEQLDGNLLGPLLLSKGVHVHPVVILISLLAGSTLFGFWGILLAVPIAAFLQLLYLDYYKESDWYKKPATSEVQSDTTLV